MLRLTNHGYRNISDKNGPFQMLFIILEFKL